MTDTFVEHAKSCRYRSLSMSIILKLSLFLSILIYFKGLQRKSEILLTCQMSLWDECEIHDLFCCNLSYEELEGLMVIFL